MNIQSLREDLASVLESITPQGWVSSLVTRPEIHTGLIQIGHATENQLLSMARHAVTLRVTLWANEGVKRAGVSDLYGLLSPGPMSIRAALNRPVEVPNSGRMLQVAGPLTVEEVGPRDEGPTEFLAVDILIPFEISAEES